MATRLAARASPIEADRGGERRHRVTGRIVSARLEQRAQPGSAGDPATPPWVRRAG